MSGQDRLLDDDAADGKYITPLRNLELAKCRTCGRDIIWTVSPAGARLPVDARPVDPHVYAIVLDADVGPRSVKVQAVIDCDWRTEDALEADRIFVSHWITCPRPPKAGGAQEARGRRPPAYNAGGNSSARSAKFAPGAGPRRSNL